MIRDRSLPLRAAVLLAALALLFAISAWPQTLTSTILGTVVDSQRSLIVGAAVTIMSEGTGEPRKAATDAGGAFSFAGLQPGSYTLRVENSGFQTYQKTGIVLTASERLSVGAVQMNVGSLAETVTVTADAAVVATASSESSASLNSRQLESISQRGRNVTSYLRLLPGANTATTDVEALNSMEIGTPLNSVGGIRGTAISIGMDGLEGQDNGTTSSYTTSQSPESVGEVKVLLNNYQAEYGRNGGAMINLITKSGTREYHGSLYWFKRHEMFNAQNFFNNRNNVPMARYRYITGGGSLGGPVTIPGVFNTSKEKLFFFVNIETNPSKEPQNIVQRTMPTALEIGGDFSQSYAPSGALFSIIDPTTKTPFSGNLIPPTRLNSSGQALMRVLPKPNRFDRSVTKGNYNYEYQDVITFSRKTELFKIDYRLSDKDSLYFRGTNWYSDRTGNVLSSGGFDFAVISNIYYNKHAVFNWTRVVSPTMVNDFNVGARRPQERLYLNDSDAASKILKRKQAGFTAGQWYPQDNPDDIMPQAGFSGGIANGPDFGNFYWYRMPQYEDDINLTVSDGFTINRGAHTFKVGMYYEKARITAGYGMGTIWNGYFIFPLTPTIRSTQATPTPAPPSACSPTTRRPPPVPSLAPRPSI